MPCDDRSGWRLFAHCDESTSFRADPRAGSDGKEASGPVRLMCADGCEVSVLRAGLHGLGCGAGTRAR